MKNLSLVFFLVFSEEAMAKEIAEEIDNGKKKSIILSKNRKLCQKVEILSKEL